MNPQPEPRHLLTRFSRHLLLERGLSQNTAGGYLVDVNHLCEYASEHGLEVERMTRDDILGLLCELHDMGVSTRTQARLIAGIRSFYNYLRLEGYIEEDPTELIESAYRACFARCAVGRRN